MIEGKEKKKTSLGQEKIGNKRNEVLIHAAVWMDLENMLLKKKANIQKNVYFVIAFI